MDESGEVSTIESDIQALERFVVENDDLLELEECIGRFNIFDALRIDRAEIRHSNFLAWLIDPNESHGQGGLFLRAMLMDLFKSARENGFPCPVSPIELDGEDLRGVVVQREHRHIDLLITCDQPRFVVAIENKIGSGEHSDQLSRYRKTVESEFGDVPSMYAFLTIEGDEASEEDWVPYSYGDVYRVLNRVRTANASSIGDDVLVFLDHYLRLIRGRLMDDPKIDELCERIYKNHRQAIELIVDQVSAGRPPLLAGVEEVVKSQEDRWKVLHRTGRNISFIPLNWYEMLPAIGARPRFDSRGWLYITLWCHGTRCHINIVCQGVTDDELREQCVECLTQSDRFGFRRRKKSLARGWNSLGRINIRRWNEDEEPDVDDLKRAVEKKLDVLWERLEGVPRVLQPVFERWEQRRS